MTDLTKVKNVSISLQQLASLITDYLKAAAGGEEQAFVLVVSTDKVMQYVSNASREDGVMLLRELFDGWEARKADIPAHYNPDLKASP